MADYTRKALDQAIEKELPKIRRYMESIGKEPSEAVVREYYSVRRKKISTKAVRRVMEKLSE